jgi:hypothetical protein
MVRFPHCAVLFVVHEGLHKWQASCPEASESSAPSSFFPAEGAAGSNAMEEQFSELRFPRA